MPELLPRFHAALEKIEDAQRIGRILRETGEVPASVVSGATAGGDRRRARGVPIVARGVGGTLPHTDPEAALLAKEARSERRR